MRLIETIRFEDGRFENLAFHQKRMNESRKALFGCTDQIDLYELLHQRTFDERKGLQKCRIKYAEEILEVAFSPYVLPSIKSLKVILDNNIDYSFKYDDRSALNQLFSRRNGCDDILIVKNGLVTDSSYANVLFFNGKDWLTPAKPLLNGTQRARLLSDELIKTAEIRLEDMRYFQKLRLINAMIRFEDQIDIPIKKITLPKS
jgi:4-amino-4-deoxychorismate lyase